MEYTIVLDAGHGGSDPGAVYEGRQEKDDNLRLALAVGDILQRKGYNVLQTRTTDIYQTPFEKATIANENGGNLFVSFHRNSSPIPNTYNGVQTLVYNDQGIKAQLARDINSNLAALGFNDLGVVERPNLVVLKRTRMPAVLIEAGFINSDRDNALFDGEFNQMAQGIADAIEQTVNSVESTGVDYSYRIQVGAFRNQYLANNLAYQLVSKGFPAKVNFGSDLYKVQVGDFENLDNAASMERSLKEQGYNTFITT